MAIYTERVVMVNKDTAKMDNDIYIYKGNRNICIQFKIIDSQFKFRDVNLVDKFSPSHGYVTLINPEGEQIATGKAEIENATLKLTVTSGMIDEDTEVGDYTIVIDLYDEVGDSLLTIPPIYNQLHVLKRVTDVQDIPDEVRFVYENDGNLQTVNIDAYVEGAEIKTINKMPLADTAARKDIEGIKTAYSGVSNDFDQLEKNVNSTIAALDARIDLDMDNLADYKEEVNAQFKDIENLKTDKSTTSNIQQQVNNLVLGAVGDGNNAEVIQARGTYETLNDRLNQIDVITNDYYDKKTITNEISSVKEFANYKIYCNSTYKLGAYSNDNNITSKTFKVRPGKEYILSGVSGNDEQSIFYATFSSLIEDTSSNATYVDFKFIQGEQAYNAVKDYKVIIPGGVNYIVINGNSDNPAKCRETNYEYTPIFKNDIKNGIVVSDNLQTITHFTKSKNNYICRVFKHCFINNLLQLESIYMGNFIDGKLTKVSEIGTSYSDVIGPISINRGDEDNWLGSWAGGTHGVVINDIEYPTAKEINLKIYCNNEEILEDGYYYGDSKIIATNDLYFPQTIQGNDISTATKAIKETRTYNLIDKMDVDVKMEFYTNVIVTMYYGCQCLTYNMTSVMFPNNEIKSNIQGLSSNVDWNVKESKYFCSKDNMHYDVELKPYGLGTWKYNTSNQFGYLANFSKIYFILMQNQSEVAKIFDETNVISWGAIYDFYID